MGAPYFDYILGDKTVIPEADRRYFTEAVIYLPDSYQCNDAKRVMAPRIPTRTEAGLPPSGFVFCCFNTAYKIRPDMFTIWMRLLRGVPGSVLWLLDDNPASTRNLKRAAQEMGIALERLVFAPRVSLEEHLARHRLAALFLDTLPCGAHTTASDTLSAGCPVLTCRGSTFAGRVAASLLETIAMPELIVDSLDAYEALALRLAREPATLREWQAKLARNRTTTPLFDTAALTRHIEAAYQTMWQRWQSGQPPQSFTVERS